MRISNRDDGLTHRMPAHFRHWTPSGWGLCPYDIPEEFTITRPVLLIMYEKCNGVQWMGGSQYSLIAVSVQVQYTAGSEPIDGVYHLVLWENKAEPILGGREEAGMPKVFADIPEYRRIGDNLSVNASHERRTFFEMELSIGRAYSAEELATLNTNNGRAVQFGWRYIPKIGPYAGPALSEATYYPVDNTYTSASGGTGSVTWTVPSLPQHPTQHDIIAALAALPVREYLPGSLRKGTSTMRMDLARSLP